MNIALILAAGSGTRMNNDLPKQFIVVNGTPLFLYSVGAFQKNESIDAIIVVASKDYVEQVKFCTHGVTKIVSVIEGGKTRQASVYNGLKEAEKFIKDDKDLILIHDSARPLVSQRIINENVEKGKKFGAVDTVIQASDTIIRSKDNETIDEILNRSELYQTQTPQTFEFGIIKKAHERAIKDNVPNVTDDCRLVMHFGGTVHFVNGDRYNFKVTTPEDLEMFKSLVK